MRRGLALALLGLCASLAGCDDMSDQPRQKTYMPEPSPPPQPQGTVQYEEIPTVAPPVTLALLQRGQEQFRIYCTPCHSELGDGNGMIVHRGFPHPPNYTSPKLLSLTPQKFYNVITHGYGIMYSFADRVKPADRWAIVAYIHALQLSQHATEADLTPQEREMLK